MWTIKINAQLLNRSTVFQEETLDEFVNDVIGNVSDNEVSFISNGIEYYATSNTMDTKQLLEVVNSISILPVGK